MTTYSKLDDVVVKNKAADINRHVHVHHHNVQSMKYTFSSPIDRQLFYQFIMRLPDEVFRLKGFVKFKDRVGFNIRIPIFNGITYLWNN